MNDSIPPRTGEGSVSNEKQLEALCSALGIVLAVVDSSGICTFLNEVAYRLLGIPSNSVIGKKLSELSPHHTPFWRSVHDTATVSIEKNNRQYRELVLSNEGTELRFLCGCVPKTETEKQSLQSYIVLLTISGSLSSPEALQRAEQERDELLAVLSHELRNPLATLRSGLKIIGLAPHAPQASKAITMMERQLMHVVRLVNDLLDVSRIQKGHLGLTRSKITVQSDGSSKGSTFRVMLPLAK